MVMGLAIGTSPAKRSANGALRRWSGRFASGATRQRGDSPMEWLPNFIWPYNKTARCARLGNRQRSAPPTERSADGAIDSPAERFASGAFRLWKGSPASSDQTITSSAALDWEIASGALRQRSAPPIEQSIRQPSDSPGGRFASGVVHNKTERCARLGNRQQSAPPTERSADEAFGSPAERFATGMVR